MHFYTFVLVDSPYNEVIENPLYFIEDILEPYSEHLEVEPYLRDCSCIGTFAYENATRSTEDKMRKTLAELRDEWSDLKENVRPDWLEYINDFFAIRDEAFEKSPIKNSPDPLCMFCFGTGVEKCTINPNAKWDWYEVGGKWSHVIQDNVQSVTDFLKNFCEEDVPYAIATYDFQWFNDENEMLETDMENWSKEVEKILKDYSNCTIVVVDCHI